MAGWSSLAFRNIGKINLVRNALVSSKNELSSKNINYVPVRFSGHGRNFLISLSQYRFKKVRDLAHFYFVLGVLPLGALVFYCNVFIGPAKLSAIPEGYVPKHWEYYEHPITRWIAKILPSPQECYETTLHKIHVTGLREKIRETELKIEELMKEREDYQAWYYVNSGVQSLRSSHELHENIQRQQGKSFGILN